MTENNFNEHPLDPELDRRLHQLRAVPPRNPDAAASGRAKFIAEVDEIVKEQGFSNHNLFTGSNRFYQRWKEKWNMASPRFRTVFSLVAAVVLVVVFLFGGAGITAYAAQSALPGDALYGVKTGVEQTRVSLAGDAADRAQLSLAFAERRLDEIARLIANGRYSDIAQAVQEYEQYVQKAIAELGTVAAGDATRAQELTAQVAVLLKRYAETLTGMIGALPDTARGEVERAIQVSNEAGSTHEEIEFVGMVEAINPDSWVIAGQTLALTAASEIEGTIEVGSLVKVEALKDTNGNLVLREVKLATQDDMDDNGNFNSNDNDDNGNENDSNANELGDDYEFTGFVEQIGADFWMIGGQMFAIGAGAEIDASIQIGNLVKVEAFRDASGNLILREVKLASGEDANENDDNSNLNDNDDDQDDDDQNSNDDNANGNINENDNGNANVNGDDDHEGNVNDNLNDNSGDDNQNSNDNQNVNDNSNFNDNGGDDDDDDSNDNGNTNVNDNDDDDDDDDNSNDSGGDDDNDNSGDDD